MLNSEKHFPPILWSALDSASCFDPALSLASPLGRLLVECHSNYFVNIDLILIF
jgi:hypothetical protein